MDLDTITALARVQFARVIIHQLELKKDWLETHGHRYCNQLKVFDVSFPGFYSLFKAREGI